MPLRVLDYKQNVDITAVSKEVESITHKGAG